MQEHNTQHTQALNRVLDYVQSHLDEDLSVNRLAEIACYSGYHFQRIFKAQMGESVLQYVQRLRLERAAEMLRAQPALTVTDIALRSGFATSAAFAKAFKQHFLMNASQWRNHAASRIKEPVDFFRLYLHEGKPTWQWQGEPLSIFGHYPPVVRLENLPGFRIAYVRNHGEYRAKEALFAQLYQQLYQWAGSHEALNEQTLAYNFYTDSPDITQQENLQVLASITIEDHIKTSGNIGSQKVVGGLYAVASFCLTNETFQQAWDWLYETWLPASGFVLDTRMAFERGTGKSNKPGEYLVEIGVPIFAK